MLHRFYIVCFCNKGLFNTGKQCPVNWELKEKLLSSLTNSWQNKLEWKILNTDNSAGCCELAFASHLGLTSFVKYVSGSIMYNNNVSVTTPTVINQELRNLPLVSWKFLLDFYLRTMKEKWKNGLLRGLYLPILIFVFSLFTSLVGFLVLNLCRCWKKNKVLALPLTIM